MIVTDAQKRARDKWDKENMTVVACKLKKEQAKAFRQYAKEQGKTVNAVLTEFVAACIGNNSDT